MSQDPLKEELIKIAGALQPHGIELIVGGGYGLLLRTEHLRDTGPKMRFDEALIARATEDLDLFLSVEIITDAGKMETIRDSLKSLGYKPKVEFFQFEKNINIGGDELFVKVDLLAPRPILEEHLKLVKIGIPRIRPRAAKEIHAYLTEEAVTLDEHRMSIVLSGAGGVQTVFLPHPFTYLILTTSAPPRQRWKRRRKEGE